MKQIFSLLRMDFLPRATDFGLLVLRAWLGLSMLLLHGWMKWEKFAVMQKQFMPLLGMSPKMALIMAIFAEVICSALLVLGLFHRAAALALAFTMGVAFFIAHSGSLAGENSGEMAFLYLAGYVALFITGPGRFSLDAAMYHGSRSRN